MSPDSTLLSPPVNAGVGPQEMETPKCPQEEQHNGQLHPYLPLVPRWSRS